jgi:hypothetical protein
MVKTLNRTFPITVCPIALLNVASLPLLAPDYLNFLKRISVSEPAYRCQDWACYDVWVTYKSLLNATGVVEHRLDRATQTVFMRHDGPIAAFEAVFHVQAGLVELACTYSTKVPMISWLIGKSLDRLLSQVAFAMDRYAAFCEVSPT